MNYEFPVITRIQDILPYIAGCDEIIVSDKGAYKVINYVAMSSDLFRPVHERIRNPKMVRPSFIDVYNEESVYRRECRGLIFDGITDELISRPYHKFFNLGEREETLPEKVDLSQPHIILNKLDGSMIRPFRTSDGVFRIGTKMGETEVATGAARFFEENDNYFELASNLIAVGFTPIFEYMSPDNRIVIDYGIQPQLILTAVRDNISGKYQDYHALERLGLAFNVPFVGFQKFDPSNAQHLVDIVRNMTDIEGFVVRFRDGHMVKLKTDQYVAIHKAKDNLLYERLVVEMILNEKVDDILPYLVETDKQRLLAYQDEFIRKYVILKNNFVHNTYQYIVEFGNSRKDFAINHSKEFGPLASIAFRHYDFLTNTRKFDAWVNICDKEVEEFFLKKTNSNSGWEQFKKDVGLDITW